MLRSDMLKGSRNEHGAKGREKARGAKVARTILSTVVAAALVAPASLPAFAADQGVAPVSAASLKLLAADVPDFEGREAVQAVLEYDGSGALPSLAELERVDYEALKAWDADAYDAVTSLRDRLRAQAAAGGEGAAGSGADGSAGAAGGAQPGSGAAEGGAAGAGAGSAGSAEDAVPVAGAPDGLVPDEVPAAEDAYDPAQDYPEWTYDGNTSFVMRHYTEDMDAQKLVAVIGEQAREVAAAHGVKASELIARALLCSDSGRSESAQAPARNLFGTVGYQEVVEPAAKADDAPTALEAAKLADSLDANPAGDRDAAVQAAAEGQPAEDEVVVRYVFGDEPCVYATYKDCLDDYAARMAKGIGARGAESDFAYGASAAEEDATEADVEEVAADADTEALDLGEGTPAAMPDEGEGTPAAMPDEATADVLRTIEDYELLRYDEPLDYAPVQPLLVREADPVTGEPVDVPASLADLEAEVTSHLGVPYLWGGTTPAGFDCSGLVQYSYREALQLAIPRTSYYQCTQGEDVDFADLHTGDLLFFLGDGVVCHVAMYLGEGCYIEAPQPGMEVKVTALDEKKPAFAKRIVATDLPDEGDAATDDQQPEGALSGTMRQAADETAGVEASAVAEAEASLARRQLLTKEQFEIPWTYDESVDVRWLERKLLSTRLNWR